MDDLDQIKALDETFEVGDEPTAYRVPSTPETRARYAVLKGKAMGEAWNEGSRLYRKGPCGITVFRL
jgi:hypothetical protein